MDTLKILKELGNTTSSANDRIDALSLKHGAADSTRSHNTHSQLFN